MKLTFDISATEFVTVRDILADIVPPGCRVWVFGSRAKNQARFNSDLDLAFEGKDKLPQIILHKLKEAFSDSPLPWRVDLLDINDVSEKFQTIIRQQAIIFPLAKSVKVPKLRFKDAQGKAFPDWEEKRLGDFYEFKSTNSLSRDKLNYDGGTVLNIHYGDIHTKFKPKFDLTKEYVPFINADVDLLRISADKYCGEGDLVIADASEDYDGIGKTIEIINLNGKNVLAGLHTLLARLSSKEIHIGFGVFVMSCHPVRKQIKTIAQGTKVLGISAGRMAKIKLTMPSLPEQQKIVAFLSSVDSKIEQLSQKKSLWEHYKKGIMQKLFPAEGETVPKLRFPEFRDAGEWNVSTIEEVGSISSGGTPSRSKTNYWNGSIPWVTTTLIDFNTIGVANEYITEVGLQKSSAKTFPKNTILMAMYGQGKTRGKVAILGIKAAINQACSAITLKKGINTAFVFQNLAARYDEIRRISNQGSQENLSATLIKKIPFTYPDTKTDEQQKIAAFLSAIDKKIEELAKKKSLLEHYKKGLLQQIFV